MLWDVHCLSCDHLTDWELWLTSLATERILLLSLSWKDQTSKHSFYYICITFCIITEWKLDKSGTVCSSLHFNLALWLVLVKNWFSSPGASECSNSAWAVALSFLCFCIYHKRNKLQITHWSPEKEKKCREENHPSNCHQTQSYPCLLTALWGGNECLFSI